MRTELEEVELEAARVRLERERLALAREQRAAGRPAKVTGMARDIAQGGVAAAKLAQGPALAIVQYLGRVLGWLIIWMLAAGAAAAFTHSFPMFKGEGFLFRTGHWIGSSYRVALPLALAYAFMPWAWINQKSRPAMIAIATGAILYAFHYYTGALQAQMTNVAALTKQASVGQTVPLSKSAGTGRYFSGSCRLMDEGPVAMAAYYEQVKFIEKDYPRLNPDLREFRQDLETLVVQQMEANMRAGYSRCVAVRLAADAVMAAR